jgi:hypothetical protein
MLELDPEDAGEHRVDERLKTTRRTLAGMQVGLLEHAA